MLAVRATPDGLEIEFTEPLAETQGEQPEDYFIQQWRYEPTAAYGGPKLDLEILSPTGIRISDDRRRVALNLPGRKREHVLYLLLPELWTSAEGQALWSGECWYTLNNIPES